LALVAVQRTILTLPIEADWQIGRLKAAVATLAGCLRATGDLAALAGLESTEAVLAANLVDQSLTTTITSGQDLLLYRTLDLPEDIHLRLIEVQRGIAVAAGIACCLTRAMWAAGVSDNIKPLVHLSDFLMGIAAACAYELLQRRARPPKGWWLYIPGFAGAAGVIAYPGVLPEFIDLNSALRPLNGMLLIGLALGGGIVARGLSMRVVVYLGKSSYAMYILHVPILWWCLRRSPEFPPLLYVAIVIAVSAAVYGLFEEPANRKLRGFLRDPARQPVPASP